MKFLVSCILASCVNKKIRPKLYLYSRQPFVCIKNSGTYKIMFDEISGECEGW